VRTEGEYFAGVLSGRPVGEEDQGTFSYPARGSVEQRHLWPSRESDRSDAKTSQPGVLVPFAGGKKWKCVREWYACPDFSPNSRQMAPTFSIPQGRGGRGQAAATASIMSKRRKKYDADTFQRQVTSSSVEKRRSVFVDGAHGKDRERNSFTSS